MKNQKQIEKDIKIVEDDIKLLDPKDPKTKARKNKMVAQIKYYKKCIIALREISAMSDDYLKSQQEIVNNKIKGLQKEPDWTTYTSQEKKEWIARQKKDLRVQYNYNKTLSYLLQ